MLLGIYGRLYVSLGLEGDGRPDMIESPTKRERFTWGVDIRVMEWICEDWTKYRVGMSNSIRSLLREYLSLDAIESQS